MSRFAEHFPLLGPEGRAAAQVALKGFIEALDETASNYGCNGDHDSSIVANAFDDLSAKLEEKLNAL